jgi:hypothetical protein
VYDKKLAAKRLISNMHTQVAHLITEAAASLQLSNDNTRIHRIDTDAKGRKVDRSAP